MTRSYAISSVIAAACAKGCIPIVARQRDSKERKVATANRVRYMEVSEFDLSDLPSKFVMFVGAQLASIASDQLKEIWMQNPGVTESDTSLWTVDALLAFAARKAESTRMTVDSIKAAMVGFVTQANSPNKVALMGALCAAAAPKMSANLKSADRLIGMLSTWVNEQEEVFASEDSSECDTTGLAVGRQILRKYAAHVAELRSMLEATTDAF